MQESTVLPYARAALAAAQGLGEADAWAGRLDALAGIAAQPAVRRLLGHPGRSAQQNIDALAQLAGEAGESLPPALERLLRELAGRGRLHLLPGLHRVYARLLHAAQGVRDVEVQAAAELDEAQRRQIEAVLGKRLEGRLNVRYVVAPELVGGFLARCEDLVLDASLRGRLARLGRSLTA